MSRSMDNMTNEGESLTSYEDFQEFFTSARELDLPLRPAGALFLEELIGGLARSLFAGLVGLKTRDLTLQQGNTLVELADRKQGQILPDLVRDLLLRTVILVDRRHGGLQQTNLRAHPVRMEPDTLYFSGSGACPYRKTGVHPHLRKGMLFRDMHWRPRSRLSHAT